MEHIDFSSPEAIAARFLSERPETVREIADRTGLKKTRISDILNGKSFLKYSEGIALGKAFDVSPMMFFPKEHSMTLSRSGSRASKILGGALDSAINHQIDALGETLSSDAVETWYLSTGGKLVEMPELRPYLVQLTAPETASTAPKVVEVGEKSMAAERVGPDKNQIAGYIDYLISSNQQTVESYHIAADANDIRSFHRKVKFPKVEEPFVLFYKSLLMPVRENDQTFIWNYSRKIFARPASMEELADPSIPEGS